MMMQYKRTIALLKDKKDIFISQADKGGKIVIMHRNISKMDQYMEENIRNHNYFKCNNLNLDYVRDYIENKYNQIRNSFNQFLFFFYEYKFYFLHYTL